MRGTLVLLLAVVFVGAPLDLAAQESPRPPEATAQSGVADQEVAQLIVIAPRAAFGKYNETTVEQDHNVWSAGLAVAWHPDSTNRLAGELMFGGYERRYVQLGVGPAGRLPTVVEDELRIGGAVTYGYNVLSRLGMGGWGVIGWRHEYFTNDRFSNNLSGVLVGGEFEYPITRDFAVGAFVDYTFNLISLTDRVDETALSFTGDLLSSLRFGAGFRFNVANVTTLGVTYRGEHLPYDHTDLLFHQAMLEIGIPIRF
jgi:hypothetical protein